MTVDLHAATAFMAAHGRLLDRRRLERLLGRGSPGAVVAATAAYANPDGGYGWGLEPDLRSPESQPAGALHALEAFVDAAPAEPARTRALADWLLRHSRPDGGLPFALPVTASTGCAPWWTGADPTVSSLQITAIVAATAHRLAAHDPGLREHPWLGVATGFCLDAIEAIRERPHAIALSFAVRLLDVVHDSEPRAPALLDRLGRLLPDDGLLRVAGGLEDELMRPLDFAPDPAGAARRLLPEGVVAAELRRLAAAQQPDGGWIVDFTSFSPAAALEWRGHATVRAIALLRRNGVL